MRIKLKPCPNCGSANIGIKDSIASLYLGKDYTSRNIWAYCRDCGYKTSKIRVNISDKDDDKQEIEIGEKLWNREVGEGLLKGNSLISG